MGSAHGILVDGVSKRFVSRSRTKQAVSSVSYDIAKGEVFGLLGANGAGKTTLIKLMSTQLAPDSGRIQVDGLDVVADRQQLRRRINVVEGGDKGLYPWLTGYENLRLFALLYRLRPAGIKARIETVLRKVDLAEDAWHAPTMTYSKGMKQRVLLAKGLINDPTVLFLDEPTIGLDFDAVQRIRDIIKDLSQSGTTVILTSHNATDIDSTCARVAVLIEGENRGVFPVEDLRAKYRSRVKFTLAESEPLDGFAALDPGLDVVEAHGGSTIVLNLNQSGIAAFYRLLSTAAHAVDNISVEGASLEDFYGTLIKEGAS
ncbi:ABC transporter ATP-binding protein [uncultured Tateyamaria sp.]|uniref:ABC transporter ATP-binding protein n=1 Tax=uncultured Tateyamaria sp. TaxID=455651 RepID=UPI00261C6A86|nr:ABC transporter ATP-binding protein [uncultured Tateyamaria sp.]